MKKLIMAALVAASLAGCAPLVASNNTATQTPAQVAAQQTANMQANWYVYCQAFKSAQPTIAQKIPTASLDVVKVVAPLSHKIAQECSKPMPTDITTAATQLTQDVTTVIVQLGIQALAPTTPTTGAKP